MNYTFESLGFQGVKPMVTPNKPKGNTYYNTIMMPARNDAITSYFIEQLYLYGKRTNKTSFFSSFVAGLAYMLDGSVILVYNGLGSYADQIGSLYADKDFYKTAPVPDGVQVLSNFDYFAGFVGSRKPEALAILQEIPSPEVGKYHFRVVHDAEVDTVYDNIINFPGIKNE